jgi:hypothetical protein
MEASKRVAILTSTVAVLILLGAFMPWGQIHGQPVVQGHGLPYAGGHPFMGGRMSLTVTGWNGTLTLAGLSLPNWLVVLATAGVAVLCWMRASSVWQAPTALPIALAGYGLVHTGFFTILLAASGDASLGVGSVVSTLAFMILLGILIRQASDTGARSSRYSRRATDRTRAPRESR